MMEHVDAKSRRSFTVLAVVVACFAVLWPKVFYPMFESVVSPGSEDFNDLQSTLNRHNFQKMIHPQMEEAMGEARPPDKLIKEGNRAWIHPSVRQSVRPHSKSAGAVNLLVPVYSIGIIIFFAYTALKMLISRVPRKKNGDHVIAASPNDKTVSCLNEKGNGTEKTVALPDRKTQRALQQYGKEKVITALKTIILEMEDIKESAADLNGLESEINLDSDVSS